MSIIQVGDVVSHPIFGLGEVTAVDATTAKVEFGAWAGDRGDAKHLVLTSVTPVDSAQTAAWRIPPTPPPEALTIRKTRTDLVDPGARREWSDDELAVLVAAYAANEFAVGDDERSENHVLASAFRRTPAAVDRQWRNVADVEKGGKVLHVGDNVVRALAKFRADPKRGMRAARAIATRNGWALGGLLDREP